MDTSKQSLHRRVWDGLPWLVAGSASTADAELARRHLPDCADCRSELAFQQHLHAHLHAQQQAQLPANLPSPDAGLHKLWARQDVAEAAAAVPAAAAVVPAAIAAIPPRRAAAAASWTRWLVAAVLVEAVAIGAAGLALLERSRDADYRTLSRPAAAAPAASVRLVPAPTMDFAALRALLAATHMAVVEAAPDGVSLGLAPQDGRPATSAAAVATLRATPGVMLAEPLR